MPPLRAPTPTKMVVVPASVARPHGLSTRHRPWQRRRLLYVRCGALAADLEPMAQPAASQRLWFRCKPLGYCQGGLDMRLNQPQDRMPPLRAPTPTKMVVVPASVASVLVRCCSRQHRSTSGLLLRTNCMHHRVRRMHGGADDVASGRLERVKARLVQGCCGPHRSTSGLLLCTTCTTCRKELMT